MLSTRLSRYPRTCLRNEECLADRAGDILRVEEQCELSGFTFNATVYKQYPVSILKSINCYYYLIYLSLLNFILKRCHFFLIIITIIIYLVLFNFCCCYIYM